MGGRVTTADGYRLKGGRFPAAGSAIVIFGPRQRLELGARAITDIALKHQVSTVAKSGSIMCGLTDEPGSKITAAAHGGLPD